MTNLNKLFLNENSNIEKALKVIGSGAMKIALVVNNHHQLLGTLSDGDIRRGLLRKKTLKSGIKDIYNNKPIVARSDHSAEQLLNLCLENRVSHIPIVGKENQIIDLYSIDGTVSKKFDNYVILMVGGVGKRLRPLTNDTPKPMLKIGDKPILQIIVENFAKHGFTNIVMCLGYKSNVIKDYFQDGKGLGVNIQYVTEDQKMGTAGALTLLKKKPNKSFFVMNGDLLTNVNFEELLDFHESSNAKATMCVREYQFQVPYGVVEIDKDKITSIQEKPLHSFFVNAGIYMLEPEVIDLIPDNKIFDMTLLFDKLISQKNKTVSFPVQEYWLDIGNYSDFTKAQKDIKVCM